MSFEIKLFVFFRPDTLALNCLRLSRGGATTHTAYSLVAKGRRGKLPRLKRHRPCHGLAHMIPQQPPPLTASTFLPPTASILVLGTLPASTAFSAFSAAGPRAYA